MEEKLFHANSLKQYMEHEVVDSDLPRKEPTIAAAWVVEQDEKSLKFDAGKIPLRPLKQKESVRGIKFGPHFRTLCRMNL